MNSSFQKIAKAGIGNLKEILKIGKVDPEGLAVLGDIEEYLTGLLDNVD